MARLLLLLLGKCREGHERVASDRRRDELARKVEGLARLRGDLLSGDERSQEDPDRAVVRHEPRDEQPRRDTDPLGLIGDRPVEDDGAVRGIIWKGEAPISACDGRLHFVRALRINRHRDKRTRQVNFGGGKRLAVGRL